MKKNCIKDSYCSPFLQAGFGAILFFVLLVIHMVAHLTNYGQ